ncbi:CAP domain-containing protein [uncultured Roseobacter sp.]|uniref:CAP domain-containing protein n=1 Tax=uncultured Roseobacter sp. TaxID=114847 RepID=UPI00260A6A4E|nr:CAP domain-containing protein [uncultured Roseobacter sp.]
MRAVLAVAAVLVLTGTAGADPAALRSVNTFRAENGRTALQYSAMLETAALAHARDMIAEQFFAHTGSDGSGVSDRVTRAGYAWCVVAENIAKGQNDLAEVMAAWAGSEGHRRNMLSREVTEFALVHAAEDTWVMVLARPGC